MKIKDMIEIIGIKDIPLNMIKAGKLNKDKLSIWGDRNGINFYEDETIWSVSINENCKEEKYEIEQKIRQSKYNINNIELNKYVAIYEVLQAINEYNNVYNDISIEKLGNYTNKLNEHIMNNLDFKEISNMEILKSLVSEDKFYRELYFFFFLLKGDKKNIAILTDKEKSNYKFGNIKYYEELNRVNIYIYNDYIELVYEAVGRKWSDHLISNLTLEEKIIRALDIWKTYYSN